MKFIYVTCKNKDEASLIAERALACQLAACANIFASMESLYHYNGKLCRDQEAVLLLKTSSELQQELTELIMQSHSYDTPCILSLPGEHLNQSYQIWFASQLKSPRP